MNNKAFEIVKKVIVAVLICMLFLIVYVAIYNSSSMKTISDVKEYVKTGTKVLYITNKKNYKKEVKELLDKYEIEYKYVDTTDIDKIDKTRLEKLINSKYITNIIVVFVDGKVKDALIDYENYESLTTFLKHYSIIPEVLDDISGIFDNVENSLDTDFTVLYLPYKYSEEIDNQEKILKIICSKYNISFRRENIYLLSSTQQEKINKLLQISEVDDQIVIFIKNKKIIGSVRGQKMRYQYIEQMNEFEFIDNIDIVNEIGTDSFEKLVHSENKNIIVIGKNNCDSCTKVLDVMSNVLVNTDYTINYLNVETQDSDLYVKVKDKLKELEYEEGVSFPMVLITENNKLLDYSIDLPTEQYLIDMFTENGIIK